MTDSPSPFRASAMSSALVAIGLATVIVGIAWNFLVPSDTYWSLEDANDYNEAYDAAHAASSGHSHRPGESHTAGEEVPSNLEAARERLEQAEKRLHRARQLQNYSGKAMSVAGVVLALLGLWIRRAQGGQPSAPPWTAAG